VVLFGARSPCAHAHEAGAQRSAHKARAPGRRPPRLGGVCSLRWSSIVSRAWAQARPTFGRLGCGVPRSALPFWRSCARGGTITALRSYRALSLNAWGRYRPRPCMTRWVRSSAWDWRGGLSLPGARRSLKPGPAITTIIWSVGIAASWPTSSASLAQRPASRSPRTGALSSTRPRSRSGVGVPSAPRDTPAGRPMRARSAQQHRRLGAEATVTSRRGLSKRISRSDQ